MRTQVKWAYKGFNAKNGTLPLLQLYLERKALSEIGFRYDLDDISALEGRAYCIIDNEIQKLRAIDSKKAKKGN